VVYDVMRREHRVDMAGPQNELRLERVTARVNPRGFNRRGMNPRFLQADALVPITGKPAEIARAQVEGKKTVLEKARALYDYTLENMSYDKSGKGWGRGDALYACDAKRGNCTDFHSLFISMARSQGIAAKFEIGFPLAPVKAADAGTSVAVAGYHCWAEFWDPERGWVPIDISEAWKERSKTEYFFGAHDVNRVQFSTGRDVLLVPQQRGAAVNYFVYPYVEVGGESWPNVETAFSYRELE
jgi:transglutaminase-like putative cysteine protease